MSDTPVNPPVVLRMSDATFLYRNHRGELGIRTVRPSSLWKGNTDHHSEMQWFLEAFDMHKEVDRSFALADVLAWFLPPKDVDKLYLENHPLLNLLRRLTTVFPEDGACLYCRKNVFTNEEGHASDCVWEEARSLIDEIESLLDAENRSHSSR